AKRRRRGQTLRGSEAAAVLVDELMGVEPEIVRVGAEESLRVGRTGEDIEAILLERAKVFRADPRVALDLRQLEAATQTRLAKAAADLEHPRSSAQPVRKRAHGAKTQRASPRRCRRAGRRRRARARPAQ